MKKQHPLSPEEIYSRAAARCAAREYCRSEWRERMMRAGLTAEEAEKQIDRLEDEGFIDEKRYALAFVHDKTCYDRWGRLKTRQALRMKGIPTTVADEALAGIDGKDYAEGLRRLLQTKEKSLPEDLPEHERRARLARYAAGRGFEAELIFDII